MVTETSKQIEQYQWKTMSAPNDLGPLAQKNRAEESLLIWPEADRKSWHSELPPTRAPWVLEFFAVFQNK
jgi:hypothetical protein